MPGSRSVRGSPGVNFQMSTKPAPRPLIKHGPNVGTILFGTEKEFLTEILEAIENDDPAIVKRIRERLASLGKPDCLSCDYWSNAGCTAAPNCVFRE